MPMPPPPPPGPPPAPGPPAPSVFSAAKSKGNSGDNHGALLQSIRQGTKLKKAVTVDKSAPLIAGRVGGSNASSSTNSSVNNDISRTKPAAASSNNQAANGLALGGLFAGGMPKLRSTGLRTGANQSSSPNHVADNVRKPVPEPTRQNSVSPVANSNHLNEVLRRQLAGDIRNRGPPPQPPSSRNNITTDSTDSWSSTTARSVFNNKLNSVAPPLPVQSSLHHNKNNNSFLHQTNTSGSINVLHNITQPLPPKPISHGKPNVAPKPPPNIPTNKPATPPKKLVMNGRVPVSRAQSMRVPRSPPVAPPSTPPFPPAVNGKDFGTIRGIPTAFHQSQENLSRPPTHHHRNQTLPVNLIKSNAPQPPSFRPNVRPPVPPPPSKTGSNINLKAPLSPPPPPPTSAPPPPPPPPHRTSPAPPPPPSHTRPPPAIPTNGPPPPPVRNSSMRNGAFDFDTRFSNLFHPVTDLVAPMRFRGFTKMYSSKSAVNKQQAPLPPNSVQLGNKLWESSTC